MEEKEIHPEESLKLITAMINTAKNKLADDGFYFILWGWLVAGAAIIHYLGVLAEVEYSHMIWAVLMPLGGVVSMIYGRKEDKERKVKTHLDTYLAYVWWAVLGAMTICLVFGKWNGFHQTYFFLMLLYGIGSMVTGGIINFRPLVIGSLFSFAFAALSVFLVERDLLLCIAGALFCSHIIPGHLLRSEFKSQHV